MHTAETGSLSYGLFFRLRLLSTPPRGDAVTLRLHVYDTYIGGLSPPDKTTLHSGPFGYWFLTPFFRKKSDPSRAVPPTKILADSVGRFPWEGAAQPVEPQRKHEPNAILSFSAEPKSSLTAQDSGEWTLRYQFA